ncbi:MAG: hypothetical protein K6B39_03695 [Lachnospiraceae bacterium]|nr:hypothetical protein [Lachnospiraceae bacterium]
MRREEEDRRTPLMQGARALCAAALLLVCAVSYGCSPSPSPRENEPTVTQEVTTPKPTATTIPEEDIYLIRYKARYEEGSSTFIIDCEFQEDGEYSYIKTLDGYAYPMVSMYCLKDGSVVTATYTELDGSYREVNVKRPDNGETITTTEYFSAYPYTSIRKVTEYVDADGNLFEREVVPNADGEPGSLTFYRSDPFAIPYFSSVTGADGAGVVRTCPDEKYLRATDGQPEFALVEVTTLDILGNPKEKHTELAVGPYTYEVSRLTEEGKAERRENSGYEVVYRLDNSPHTVEVPAGVTEVSVFYDSVYEGTIVGGEFDGVVFVRSELTREEEKIEPEGSYRVYLSESAGPARYLQKEYLTDASGRPVSETTFDPNGAIISQKLTEYSEDGRVVTEKTLRLTSQGVKEWEVNEVTRNEAGLVATEKEGILRGDIFTLRLMTSYEYDERNNYIRVTSRNAAGEERVIQYENTYSIKKKPYNDGYPKY